MSKQRNASIDIVRGIAILMVVLGHTLGNSHILYFENTCFFKVIWSLQMPLFFIISGYVTKYSKKITKENILQVLKKRSIAYLLPWCVWTIFVKGFFLGHWNLYNLKDNIINIIFHLDSGYWFLVCLWFLVIIFTLSSFLANLCIKDNNKIKYNIFLFLFSFIFLIILAIIGKKFGMDFLGIKFVLYYYFFYMLGYLYSILGKYIIKYKEILYFVCVLIYFVSIVYFNSYLDSNILYRLIQSTTGCFLLIIIVKCLANKFKLSIFELAGKESLCIYLVHYLFLSLLMIGPISIYNLKSIILILFNYAICLSLTSLLIYIINYNKYTRFIFFYKSIY